MTVSPVRKLAVLFLAAQGFGAFGWWLLLWAVPSSRAAFLPPGWPTSTLAPFLVGDLTLFAGGALAAAYGIARRRPWAWTVLCIHSGAALYAGLFSLSLPLLFGSPWLAAAVMAPSVIGPPLLLWRLRPEARTW